METRYSLCPNCDSCPEVIVGPDAVLIGEEGNLVRLSAAEWNVLVAAIKAGQLDAISPDTQGSSGHDTPARR